MLKQTIQQNDIRINTSAHNSLQDLLSQMLIDFSTLLAIASKLMFNKCNNQIQFLDQNVIALHKRLAESLFSPTNVAMHILGTYQEISSTSTVLKRFRCRLVQAMIPCKERIQKYPAYAHNLSSTIKKIEKLFFIFQNGLTLQQFSTHLFQIFQKYIAFQNQQNPPDSSPQKLFSSTQKPKIEEAKSNSPLKLKTFCEQSQYNKKMKQNILEINQMFKTISLLGLHYQYFKTSFFQAKNKQLYQDYLERNQSINDQVVRYSKNFQQYLKKKERKRMIRRLNLKKEELMLQNRNYQQNKTQIRFKNLEHDKKSYFNHPNHQAFVSPENKRISNLELTSYSKEKKSNPQKIHLPFHRQQKNIQKTKLEMKSIIITPNSIILDSEQTLSKKSICKSNRKKPRQNKKFSLINLPQLSLKNNKKMVTNGKSLQ